MIFFFKKKKYVQCFVVSYGSVDVAKLEDVRVVLLPGGKVERGNHREEENDRLPCEPHADRGGLEETRQLQKTVN